MSDAQASGGANTSGVRRVLEWLGVAIVFALAVTALKGEFGQEPPGGRPSEDCEIQYRQELRSYLWGIGLALLLTGIPYALVYWHAAPQSWLFIAIGAFALVQIVVHFRFFLHINFSEQKREDLHLILFSTLILALMVGGTLWILLNLAARMR